MERALSPQPEFLPSTRAEMDRLGWDELDVLLVSGDAHVDHPAFGVPLLGRWLVAHGFRTGIIAQPRWDSCGDFRALGRPRLFAGVGPGAVDSMLAHYTAFRKLRRDDPNTPGGRHGRRPNRAGIVYAMRLREAFPGLPVILGGIEASLRRASHYDFWTDALRRSILLDAKADVILYGMAERTIVELAFRLSAGSPIPAIPPPAAGGTRGGAGRTPSAASPKPWAGMAGVVYAESGDCGPPAGAEVETLPSHEEILAEPRRLLDATLAFEQQVHNASRWLSQRSGGRTLWFAPPAEPLSADAMDRLYALPFARRAHPVCDGPVPALAMLQDSVTSHRGCGGGCSFCSLASHQGRRIVSRSAKSILDEISRMTRAPGWRGSISDIGGPSANMWGAHCGRRKAAAGAVCRRASCLWPRPCPDFKTKGSEQTALWRAAAALPGVGHVRVASGLRHDLAASDPDMLAALAGEFCGGQLKIAPEHIADAVLARMRKPGASSFEAFRKAFGEAVRKSGRECHVIPYLMSAFPGESEADARALSTWLARRGWRPRQVQCFIPTPGTAATAMYCAGIDLEGRPIPVARTDADRMRRHAWLTKALRPDAEAAKQPVEKRLGT